MTARPRSLGLLLTAGAAVLVSLPPRGFSEDAGAEALRRLEAGPADAATALAPAATEEDDPSVHLNTATILFYKGIDLLRGDKKPEADAIFREVEQELLTAIRFSEHDANVHRRNLLSSQCAYLLGDLHAFVFANPAIAKAFYQQSVRYVPDHTAAINALKQLDAPKQPQQRTKSEVRS